MESKKTWAFDVILNEKSHFIPQILQSDKRNNTKPFDFAQGDEIIGQNDESIEQR